MGVYRVEASPNNRECPYYETDALFVQHLNLTFYQGAGCINKECKTAGVKIMKGEFRYAIQVTIQEHQSWQYKHW